MSMTKFTGKNDLGYVRVSDVIWLWISMIEAKKKKGEAVADEHPGHDLAGHGYVHSGGGPVFVGSNNAGRDIHNINFGHQ
jgi:hypothetical protein